MSRRVRASVLLAIGLVVGTSTAAQSTVAAPDSSSSDDRASIPGPSGPDNADFNGDEFGDLAIAAPQMAVGDHDQAGGVFVLLGTENGLSGQGSQFLSNATPGVPGKLSVWLGLELSWGDYDADGYDDLAVSSPYGGVGRHGGVGYVTVIPGSAAGLTGEGSARWSFYSEEMPGGHDGGLLFGQTVFSSDVDADGFDDLVIGVPRGSVGDFVGGSGRVLYGSDGGLGAGRAGTVIRPRKAAVLGSDYFGNAMTAGDFDSDGYPDMAVGAPHRSSAGESSVGQVWVFGGGPDGLTRRPVQSWGSHSEDLMVPPAGSAEWGSGLAAGDLDDDGFDDLVVSADGAGGYVHVLFGTASGLTGNGSQRLDKQTPGLPIEPTPMGGFGAETLIADITGDGHDDLVISHTADDVDGTPGGSFLVLPGTENGPVVEGAERWNQNSPGVSEDAESLDYFGSELVASDVNSDGQLDVITSSPRESVGEVDAAGIVQMFLRSADGSGFDEDWPISRLSRGLHGDPTYPDGFGLRLAG